MPQTFHCQNPNCKTMWIEDSSEWLVTKKVQCPFCYKYFNVQVSLGKDAKPHGVIIGTSYAVST